MRIRRASGLTLLELMAASALLAIFFVSVFAIVWSTIRTRDRIEQAALPFATGPVVLQRIVDDLQCADLADLRDADGFEASVEGIAGGDVTRLDFVVAVPSRERVKVGDEWVRAAVNEVGYRLRRSEIPDAPATTTTTRTTTSGGGAAVVRHSTSRRSPGELLALYRREDFGVDADPKEGGKYYKLCDRVKRFSIDFYDEDPGEPNGDAAEGATEWDAKKERKLPWGCRVTLVLVGPGSVDGADDEDEAQRDYVFQSFVPFRTRFDKADGAAKPGTTNPGSNNPGSNNPGSNEPGSGNPGGG